MLKPNHVTSNVTKSQQRLTVSQGMKTGLAAVVKDDSLCLRLFVRDISSLTFRFRTSDGSIQVHLSRLTPAEERDRSAIWSSCFLFHQIHSIIAQRSRKNRGGQFYSFLTKKSKPHLYSQPRPGLSHSQLTPKTLSAHPKVRMPKVLLAKSER